MKTRILALLMCVVMALMGCSKVDDGFNETETVNSERIPTFPVAQACPHKAAGIDFAPFVIELVPSEESTDSEGYILCDEYEFGFEFFVNTDFDAQTNSNYNKCPDEFEWKLYTIYGPNGPFAVPTTYTGSSFTQNLQSDLTYRVFLKLTYGREIVEVGYEFVLSDGDECYASNPDFCSFDDFITITALMGAIYYDDDGGGTQIMLVM